MKESLYISHPITQYVIMKEFGALLGIILFSMLI